MVLALLVALFLTEPVPAPAPLALPSAPTVLWFERDATVRAGLSLQALPMTPGLGDVLDATHTLELAAGARLVLLVTGDHLLDFAGPGTWRVLPGSLETAFGAPPRDVPLAPYREGPLPGLGAPASLPPEDLGFGATLSLLEPRAPVARTPPRALRWHWPHEGGVFDLVVERRGADHDELVERWDNLSGREHELWATLARGATYRVSLALRDATGPSSAIVDRRVFRVLAEAEVAAIDGATASLDTLSAARGAYRPEYDVLRARLLESSGLLAEAEAVWTGLAILYPGRDELFQQAVRLHRRSAFEGE